MKKICIAIALCSLVMVPLAPQALAMTDAERTAKIKQIDLLIAQLQLMRTMLLGTSVETQSGLELSYQNTYSMSGYSGSGFWDGESFLVQEITLRNNSENNLEFSASGLRLRDSDGTVFYPVHESAVKAQPRFEDTMSGLPTDNPDTRKVNIYPNEELRVAVTFYINQVPADTKYTISYEGGDTVAVTVDN